MTFTGRLLRGAVYGSALPGLGVAALVTAALGRASAGARLLDTAQRRLLNTPNRAGIQRALATVINGLSGLLLGCLSIIPMAVEVLFVARGVLYGIVVGGPYDTSWGGPSRTGAWTAHFLVGLPLAVLGLHALWAIALLHARWCRLLRGERRNWWVVPVTLLACGAGGGLIWAWTRQL